MDDSSGSLSFADPLPKPDSPAACQQVVDAIEAWKRVAYGVHYQGPPGPQPTTVKGFDLLTESLVAWCDAYLPGMDAACLMEYREIRVQWESVQANPSHPWDWRPTDGELDKARRMADGFCNRLKKRLSTKQKKRTRMTREEANQEAMKLAKEMGSTFFLLSESEQARRIGCAWKTWNRTTFFKEAQKRQKQLSNRYAAKGKGSRPVVSFTGALEAVAGEGKKDEVLEQLIADQEADHDPSPLEDGPKRVYIRKRL